MTTDTDTDTDRIHQEERNARRICNTDYVVDTTSDEVHGIWYRWSHVLGLEMKQNQFGLHRQIGMIAARPVCVSIQWYSIAGCNIAFVEGVSELVDYKMIEEWERHTFRCLERGVSHADAANFHNVVLDIERTIGRSLPRRNSRAVDAAIRAVPKGS